MAAETSSMPVNGNYAVHQGFGAAEQNNNHAYANNSVAATAQVPPQPPPTSTTPASAASQTELSKDEVGWYFVEQYYTTLSRNPERLYLFYNKRSQFVSGMETDKVRVYGGQNAINNRIKELDFKDCKVRVTNVDAQASESNIVIQVIGEMSNKSQPHKKFAQTFVLATQTNGYFVLNDIFRYLMDEEEELETVEQAAAENLQQASVADGAFHEPPPTPQEGEQQALTSSNDPVQIERDAQELDRELEAKAAPDIEEPLSASVNGVADPEPAVDAAPEAPAVLAAPPAPVPVEPTKEIDSKPTEVAPTATPPKQATPQPAPASKPAAPKTWASMAASANKVATPVALSAAVTPDSQQARSVAASTKTVTPPAPASAAVPSAPAAALTPREEVLGDAAQGDEWTAVGGSHNRQQSRQTAPPQQDGPPTRVYIKNVNENVSTSDLKSHLEKYGDFVYFDRPGQKSFIQAEYRTPEAFAAAVNGNPHTVNGERLIVEARRPNAYQQRAGFQGGRGRGNLAPGQSRGNFAGRGGFAGRGRGGNIGTNSPRGRGDSPQTA